MQATSTQSLAALALVALQKLFLELPLWAQLSLLAAEIVVMCFACFELWRGQACRKPEPAGEPQASAPQPIVVVPLKGERDDVESDVETESTAGTDAAATDTESTEGADSWDWCSSDEDVDMPLGAGPCNEVGCHRSLSGAAWGDVGTRLAAVFREVAAFELAGSANEDWSSSTATGGRSAPAPAPAAEANAINWLNIGSCLSVVFCEIAASAPAEPDDEDYFPKAIHKLATFDGPTGRAEEVDVTQWGLVGSRVAAVLRKIASSEPMESDDEAGLAASNS